MNHSIGVTLKFADFAAGGNDHPRTPPGDLVGRDHRLALRSAAAAARAAWASADMARPCHLPFGTFPASLAAGINLFDVLAHTWDIAAATGVALECADDLWQAGLEAARAVIGPGRDPRQYAPEIPVASGGLAPAALPGLHRPGRAVLISALDELEGGLNAAIQARILIGACRLPYCGRGRSPATPTGMAGLVEFVELDARP